MDIGQVFLTTSETSKIGNRSGPQIFMHSLSLSTGITGIALFYMDSCFVRCSQLLSGPVPPTPSPNSTMCIYCCLVSVPSPSHTSQSSSIKKPNDNSKIAAFCEKETVS